MKKNSKFSSLNANLAHYYDRADRKPKESKVLKKFRELVGNQDTDRIGAIQSYYVEMRERNRE